MTRSWIPLAGRPVVVVGNSNVVDRPVQLLLVGEDGTVTPVPGEVGPVTDAVLMRHLLRAARSQPVSGSTAAAEVAS